MLLAKVGLDGHDRGVKVVARTLRDAGFEVIYLGLRNSPAAIARAAISEDVSVVGLSFLSGSHLALTREVVDALAESGDDIAVVVGGTIAQRDVEQLREAGADAVLGVGTSGETIVAEVRRVIGERR
ncbi:cobalamin-dependent protein [Terrabacter carboxydivorans]|uniref:cobalamin-dependent protein n=1 Tax=Terrabacter carboxydivorans TaxID=619730 RepID=UPI0031CF52D2